MSPELSKDVALVLPNAVQVESRVLADIHMLSLWLEFLFHESTVIFVSYAGRLIEILLVLADRVHTRSAVEMKYCSTSTEFNCFGEKTLTGSLFKLYHLQSVSLVSCTCSSDFMSTKVGVHCKIIEHAYQKQHMKLKHTIRSTKLITQELQFVFHHEYLTLGIQDNVHLVLLVLVAHGFFHHAL